MEKDKVESRTEVENIDVAGKIADALGFKHDKCGGGHHSDPCDRCFAVAEILKALAARPSVPQQGQGGLQKRLHKILDDIQDDLNAAKLPYRIGSYWYQEVNIALAASRSEEATPQEVEKLYVKFPFDGELCIGCGYSESGLNSRIRNAYNLGAPAAGSTERVLNAIVHYFDTKLGISYKATISDLVVERTDLLKVISCALAGTDTDVAKEKL